MVGTELKHYRIERVLGRGGMGEVYAAEDTKLRRPVAVKLLPPSLAGDAERRRRLEREAQMIAALNHPNIVTVFSIEQFNGRVFLTMELVDGDPLSQLIPARGMPVDRLLNIAIPLADALSAAHQQGIVHRDLKPDNVMVAEGGRVKVLDFGIARLREVAPSDALTSSQIAPLTREGEIIGTAGYLSPEQAEGRAIDTRSDLFALGIVLYEMATGERPFKGETAVSILSSIIKDPAPPITSLNPTLPHELARIVRRCLAKDPARRYQTAADVRNDLEELQQELSSGARAAVVPRRDRSRWREITAWMLAAALLAASIVLFVKQPARSSLDVLSVLPPDGTLLTEGEAPQISPDGRTLAFVGTDSSGKTLLYLRERESDRAEALDETDDAAQPFWSPDSRSIGFFAGGQLKTIAVSGGRPQRLASAPVPRGGAWNQQGTILFVPHPQDPPLSIPATGGKATPVPIRKLELRWFPSFLPDGRRYVFLSPGLYGQPRNISVGTLEGPEATVVTGATVSATYLETGHLVFAREEALVAQPFDASSLRLVGAPITLAEKVSVNPITYQTLFSASAIGALAYMARERGWQLTWFDQSGKQLGIAGVIGGFNSLCLSSDGHRLIHDSADTRTRNLDIWSLNLDDGTTSRLTFDAALDFYPACSVSGDEVIFASTRAGRPNPYRLSASVPEGVEALFTLPSAALPTHWSRDRRHLLQSVYSPQTDWDVWVLPLDGGQPFAYAATAAAEKNAQMSPNGRWVAYTTNQSGNEEVLVQSFPISGGRRWQISANGGRQPQWRSDGNQLFYLSLDKKLMAVDVDPSGATFVPRQTRVVVDAHAGGGIERTYQGNLYAVSPDGERFLLAIGGEAPIPITYVLNWQTLLAGR